MANNHRTQNSDLIERLIEKSSQFSFIQAYRLLCLILKEKGVSEVEEIIRIRPKLSLDFPGTDIVKIEKRETNHSYQFDITTTFLGLYGASSPLPTYYTEMLLEEKEEDRSITRDFIDILNNPLYHLLFQRWSKYELGYKIIEEQDTATIDRLYALIGLKIEEFREKVENHKIFLSYIGLISQFPRSATSLEILLKKILNLQDLEIVQCVFRWASIPQEQWLHLGQFNHSLGESTYLGEKIQDRMGKFAIIIEIKELKELLYLLPFTEKYKQLIQIIDFYLDQPLKWDLIVKLDSTIINPIKLGQQETGYLGWNTWLGKTKTNQRQKICLAQH